MLFAESPWFVVETTAQLVMAPSPPETTETWMVIDGAARAGRGWYWKETTIVRPAAREFVTDAHNHFKFIGYSAGAEQLLDAALPSRRDDGYHALDVPDLPALPDLPDLPLDVASVVVSWSSLSS